MSKTSIEWAQHVWNPTRGCSRVSAGCDRCYAMGQAHRFSGSGQPYEGLTTIRRGKVDWAGMARFVPEQLDVPLRRRKPTTWFVNSMSDLFHESLKPEEIAKVFGVMAVAAQPFFGPGGIGRRVGTRYDKGKTNPRPIRAWGVKYGPHTFQVLTKRAERAKELLSSSAFRKLVSESAYRFAHDRVCAGGLADDIESGECWPLPNVHLGVSAEDQPTADKRIPLLLQCPAAVRWVSLEPLLGAVSFRLTTHNIGSTSRHLNALTGEGIEYSGDGGAGMWKEPTKLDWAVAGSESGPRARPMQLEWIESLRDQCAAAGVPFFTKQIANKHDKKGGDPKFWPGGPWPREFPEVRS